MRIIIQRCFSLLFCTSLVFCSISAEYTPPQFSYESQQAVELQSLLNKYFGQQEPFVNYISTIYYLIALKQKLHEISETNGRANIENLMNETDDLFDALEKISIQALACLRELYEENLDEDSTNFSNHSCLVDLFTILNTSRSHLDTYATSYLAEQQQQLQQGGQIQPVWSQHSMMPPPGHWHQYHTTGYSNFIIIAKILAVPISVTLGYFFLRWYFRSGFKEKLDITGSNLEEIQGKLNILEGKQTKISENMGTTETDLKEIRAILKEIRAIVKNFLSEPDRKNKIEELKKIFVDFVKNEKITPLEKTSIKLEKSIEEKLEDTKEISMIMRFFYEKCNCK